MLVLRFLSRFLMHAAPDEGGGGGGGAAPSPAAPAAAPAEPAAAAPAAPTATPVADPAATPAEPFSALTKALDAVGTPEPAAPSPAASQPRVAGKFAAASQQAAGVASPAAAPIAPAPKPGEVDLTPPEGMNERASARWSQLTERAKLVPVLEQRATEANTALDSVRKLVSDSGLAANEFTDMLEMSRLARSQNPQDAQRALQMLDAQRAQLATRLGIDAPGVDVLAQHPDLKADVDGMLMTRERALEIVRLRNSDQQTQRNAQANEAATREHAQFVQTVNGAAASMERTLASRAGTPGHEAKVKYIHGHFSNPENLQRFVSTYQPQQWESVLLTMYEAFNPAVAAPAVPQPLRPGHVGAGVPIRTGPVTAGSSAEAAMARLGW